MGGDLRWSGRAMPGQKCMAFAPPTNILGEERQIFKIISLPIILLYALHGMALMQRF